VYRGTRERLSQLPFVRADPMTIALAELAPL